MDLEELKRKTFELSQASNRFESDLNYDNYFKKINPVDFEDFNFPESVVKYLSEVGLPQVMFPLPHTFFSADGFEDVIYEFEEELEMFNIGGNEGPSSNWLYFVEANTGHVIQYCWESEEKTFYMSSPEHFMAINYILGQSKQSIITPDEALAQMKLIDPAININMSDLYWE